MNKEQKRAKTVVFEEDILESVVNLAKKEKREFSSQVNWMLAHYINQMFHDEETACR